MTGIYLKTNVNNIDADCHHRTEFEAIVKPLHDKAYELLQHIHNDSFNFDLRDELANIDLQIIESYIPGYEQTVGWDLLPIDVKLQFNQLRRLMAESLNYNYNTDTRDARELAAYTPEMIKLVHKKNDMIAELLRLLAGCGNDGNINGANDDRIRVLHQQVVLSQIFTPRDLNETTVRCSMRSAIESKQSD